MTTSAIGCRGWGSRRAGRILTLPGASRAPRSPTHRPRRTPPATPMGGHPPAEEKASLRREATSWDDGCSVTKSNANAPMCGLREKESQHAVNDAAPAACVASCPRGRDRATGVRRGERCPSRLLVPDTRPTSAARLDRRGWGGDCLTGKVLT